MAEYYLVPRNMVDEGRRSYLNEGWPEGVITSGDLWGVVHGALIQALTECADYHKAKFVYHRDGDGFFDYSGTIDVNVMAAKIEWHVKNKLRSETLPLNVLEN